MGIRSWLSDRKAANRKKYRDKIVEEYKRGYDEYAGKRNVRYSSTIYGGSKQPPYDQGALDAIAKVSFEKGLRKCLRNYGVIIKPAEDFPDYQSLADFMEEQSCTSGDHFMVAAQAIRLLDAYQRTELKVIWAELNAGTDEFLRFIDDRGNEYRVNRVDTGDRHEETELVGPLVILSGEQDS